ncbi:hypothetical protein [Nocardia sp. NPDC055049]
MPTAPCSRCARPVSDGLALCTECVAQLVDALNSVPALVAELGITRAGLSRSSAARAGGRSSETPIPVRANRRGRGIHIAGDRVLAALDLVLIGWARVLAEDLAVSPAVHGPHLVQLVQDHRKAAPGDPTALGDPATIGEQCAIWLAQHRRQLRTHAAVGDLLDELEDAMGQIRAIIDPGPRRPVGSCTAEINGVVCAAELFASEDSNWIRCPQCRTQHDVHDIERAAKEGAQDMRYTLYEAVRVTAELGTPIAQSTLYRWAAEGRIRPGGYQHVAETGIRITDHKIHPADRPVYRLGDITAVAAAAKQQQKEGSTA